MCCMELITKSLDTGQQMSANKLWNFSLEFTTDTDYDEILILCIWYCNISS